MDKEVEVRWHGGELGTGEPKPYSNINRAL